MFHLGAEALEEWCFFVLGRKVVREIFFFAVAGRLDPQAAEFEAVEFGEQRLQFMQIDSHFIGNLIFVGRASKPAGELVVGDIDEATLAA